MRVPLLLYNKDSTSFFKKELYIDIKQQNSDQDPAIFVVVLQDAKKNITGQFTDVEAILYM